MTATFKKSVVREYFESIVIAVILALFVRTWLVQAWRSSQAAQVRVESVMAMMPSSERQTGLRLRYRVRAPPNARMRADTSRTGFDSPCSRSPAGVTSR